MSVQFYINCKSFSFRFTVHLFFSFLLQNTFESVFLPRYESLKLNHDTNYLMKSEDTVVDPLMGVQFNIKSRGFFVSCYSLSTVFFFIAKDAWICISTMLWIFKTKPWHKLFDDICRHGCRSVDDSSISYKEHEFFHFKLQSIYCLHFYCKRRLNLYFDHAMNL